MLLFNNNRLITSAAGRYVRKLSMIVKNDGSTGIIHM